jgi:CHAD domain-containing protein
LTTWTPAYVVGPVRDRLLGMLRADHDASRARLVAGLDSRRYERLLSELTEAVIRPPYLGELAHAPAPDVVARLSGKAAAAVVRTAQKAKAAEPAERDEIIHDVRKRAKAARYADEAVTPVLGVKGAAPAWTKLQEALGDYQDGVVAIETIQRACGEARAAGEDTFTYGVLVEREAAEHRRIREQYEALLRPPSSAASRCAAEPQGYWTGQVTGELDGRPIFLRQAADQPKQHP